MRYTSCVVALVFALCAAAASAQESTVALARGEGLTLTLSEDGAASILSRTSAPIPPSDTEEAMVAGVRHNPAAMGSNVMPLVADTDAAASVHIDPGRIVLRFLSVRPHDTVLLIENGYDQGLVYHATITVNDQSTPTDVCMVLPLRHGAEHWPYPIDRIELSNLTLTPWRDGDPLPCR